MTPAIVGLALAGLVASGAANALAIPTTQTFSKTDPKKTLSARPDAFYNLTMGYQGWSMHSDWGNVKLQKGKIYTITAVANPELGFHPGVALWQRPQGTGLVPNTYVYDHMYSQFANIFAQKVQNDEGKNEGTYKAIFVVNGVDRDGWDAAEDPAIYDQGPVTRLLDGVPGRVQVQFVAPYTGWYQFAVGGIHPDAGLPTTVKYPVDVTIEGF